MYVSPRIVPGWEVGKLEGGQKGGMRGRASCKVPREQIRIWAAHREMPYVYLKFA